MVIRPDISYYNKSGEVVDDMDLEDDIDPDVSSAKGKSKDKKKGLTEVKIEYTKRRVDENHFGPLSYAEVMAARNEEPWVVGANSNILMV